MTTAIITTDWADVLESNGCTVVLILAMKLSG